MTGWFTRWLRQRGKHPPPDEARTVLPPAGVRLLHRNLPIYRRVPVHYRADLHALIVRFLNEKEFWGARHLSVTEEMKLIIAAQACLMVVRLPRLGLFPQTREIIVYPSEFGEAVEAIGPDGRVYRIRDSRAGEISRRGPVLLAWDAVRHSTRASGDGYNTVFHEFAHALDYLDGEANGAPPLEESADQEEWRRVWGSEFNRMTAAVGAGRRTFLDPYGAEDPAEFFAVATESFFERPRRFQRAHPALYRLLSQFFQLDPEGW